MAKPEIYSDLTTAEALDGRHIDHPAMRRVHEIMVARDLLRVIPVVHLGYDMLPDEKGTPIPDSVRLMQGQAVVHRDLVGTFQSTFNGLREVGFLIHRALPGLDEENRSNDARLGYNNISHVYRLDAYGNWDEDPRTWTARGHMAAASLDLGLLEAPLITYDHRVEPARAIGRAPFPPASLPLNPRAVEVLRYNGFDIGCEWRVAGTPDFCADEIPEVPDDKHHGQIRGEYLAQIELPDELFGSIQ